MYLTHTTTSTNCPSRQQISSMETYPQEVLDVGDHIIPENEVSNSQTNSTLTNNAGLAHIEHVPAQILSLTESVNRPMHIELNNGATCSYIIMQEATDGGFNIYPNSQASQLGDGITMIKSCGEIDVLLYKNDHERGFRAIVAQSLHCPVIGGTTFIKDNNIKQDFVHNQIYLLGNKCTVPSMQREALLPIAKHISTSLSTLCTHKSTHTTDNSSSNNITTIPLAKVTNPLGSIKSKKIILPGDYLSIKTDLLDQDNGYYGRHLCNLNWMLQQRPTARKVPIASYSHDLKGVMQEICDKLTDQGVLKVPQHHNILVQSVCPLFLRWKRKAADTPTHLLTKYDIG